MSRRRQLIAAAQNSTPQWMREVAENYGIPLQNLKDAYAIDPDIKLSFDGTGRWLISDGYAYITTSVTLQPNTILDFTYRVNGLPSTSFNRCVPYAWQDNTWLRIERVNYAESAIGGSQKNIGTIVFHTDTDYHFNIDLSNGVFIIGDNKYTFASTVYTLSYGMTIFYGTRIRYAGTVTDMAIKNAFKIYKDGNLTNYFIPFDNNGDPTLVDLMADNCIENLPTKTGTLTIE